MSRPIIVDKDFPVQGFGQPLEPTAMTAAETVVLNSPTGKYPRPLEETPAQHPSRYEAARAHAIKCAQFPKA
jgi:hypothetical protein